DQEVKHCCKLCPAGHYKVAPCRTENTSPTCEKCTSGTYLSFPNYENKCLRCSFCDSGVFEIVLKNCTATNNVECGCPQGRYQDCAEQSCAPVSCQECRKCVNRTERTPCSTRRNTECGECLSGFYEYRRECRSCSEFFLRAVSLLIRPPPTLLIYFWLLPGSILISVLFPLVSYLKYANCMVTMLHNLMLCCCFAMINPRAQVGTGEAPWLSSSSSSSSFSFVSEACGFGPGIIRKKISVSGRAGAWKVLEVFPTNKSGGERAVHSISARHTSSVQRKMPDGNTYTDLGPRSLPHFLQGNAVYKIIDVIPAKRWKEFMRTLELADSEIDCVELEVLGFREQQYEMLKRWNQQNNGTLDLMYSALERMNLSGCAEQLKARLENNG
uniref:Tumor necrosis factor receptor superfamily member 6 n=1 Tax=Latimeria chalumnae TaxID=7897 RepID=H3B9M5_LATCH